MEKLLNNKKEMVVLDYFIAVNMISQDFESINSLIENGKKYLGANVKIVFVGDIKKIASKENEYVVYARFTSGKPVDNGKPYLAYAYSDLALMWFDNKLNDITEKAQKYLSEIDWDKHAENIYS